MDEVCESAESEETLAEEALDEADPFVRYRKGPSRARLTLSAGSSTDLSKIMKDTSSMASKTTEGETASRMLRRKIPQSGHLMMPRRLWMQTVPTQDCETVIVFPPSASEASVNFLVNRLKARVPEVVVTIRSHQASNAFVLYVTSTLVGLLKGGQELRLNKKTKPEFGNGSREFTQNELQNFQGIEEPFTFFTSRERQSIVLYLLNSLRAVDGDEIASICFRPGQGIVSSLVAAGIIQQILPLHDHQQLRKLRTTWVQSFFSYQPLDAIQQYFGSKIAIYFSWLGFYTASLIVPAIIGFVFWINFWGKDQAKEDKAFVILALLNVLWGSAWLEAWKRRSAELSFKWGTIDYKNDLLEDPRPMFKGKLGASAVTGRIEPIFPRWKRNVVRYFISLPVILLWISIVFWVMFLTLEFQGWWDSVLENRGSPGFLSYGPRFLIAAVISMFDELSTKLAHRLTDLENYRGENEHHNHVIIKVAVLRLLNSFFVLFYIAFYLQDMDGLKGQLAALFITRQVVGNIKESCVPYILEQFKLAKLSFELFGALSPSDEQPGAPFKPQQIGSQPRGLPESSATMTPESLSRTPSKSRIVGQAEVESNMSKYDDAFEDYLEMFIQFGYVMLFSSAFPLAAMCAFINNLIEIRSDAFKLCCVFQRPFAQNASSIGVWQDMMELMGVLGIMVNCMLIGMSGQVHRMFPEMSTTQTILLIVVLEHLLIALKYAISYAIPDTPEWVAHQIAKSEFHRRETLKRLSSSSSPPTREGSGQSSPKSSSLSNMISTEYVERSVQTDINHPVIKKTIEKIGRGESFAFPRDFLIPKRKSSMESKPSETETRSNGTNLGRSVSACDRVKHCIPKTSKRWNQSGFENFQNPHGDHFIGKPTPSESLPALSTPSNYELRSRALNFSPEREHHYDHTDVDAPSSQSISTDSIVSNTIREESIASDVQTETETLKEEPSPVKKNPPAVTSLTTNSLRNVESVPPVSTKEGEHKEEATSLLSELPKIGKKHPAKFLKRAQSFSQVFKRKPEKKKKSYDHLRDDYSLLLDREPLGELDLVNLDKLVSMDDLQQQFLDK